VEEPSVWLSEDGVEFRGGRVVARNAGFDLLAGSDATGVVARRIELADEAPFARLGEVHSLSASKEHLLVATRHGARLGLCARPVGGEQTVRQYEGLYALSSSWTIGGWNDFSCNGLAWSGSRGVVSWRLCPSDGGLCYAVVQELNDDGIPQGQPERALGDGELWVASVSDYGAGIAWAGGMGGPLQVWFSPAPGAAQRVDIADAAPDDRTPRLARWPFSNDAVAVGWDEGRLVVVRANGVAHDHRLVNPAVHRMTRPALASGELGLVSAHAECGDEADAGALVVTLWGPTAEALGDPIRLPSECPTEAASVAMYDEHVVVLWPHRASNGYQGARLRVVRASDD
jgi:hypothetical protein